MRSPRRPPRAPRGWCHRGLQTGLSVLILTAAGWTAGTPVSRAEEPPPSESQVKAACLINFPKYVDWPVEAFAGRNHPVVIAVLGETKVADELQKIIAGRSVNGRHLVLKRMASGEQCGVCHILFVSAKEQPHSSEVLAGLKEGAVLTVGESDDFLGSGGMINLARRDEKVALEVNLTAAGHARIKISSKLLNLARVVKGRTK